MHSEHLKTETQNQDHMINWTLFSSGIQLVQFSNGQLNIFKMVQTGQKGPVF
jgi:hypothetical protein